MFDSIAFPPLPVGTIAVSCLLILVMIILTILILWRNSRNQLYTLQKQEQTRKIEYDLEHLLKSQSEMQGKLQIMADIFGSKQTEFNKTIRENLDQMTERLSQSMTAQTKSTYENLTKLQERLAVIDHAQNNIQSLAGQVVELQAILSNKQTRGLFGQGRMETIIADALPLHSYAFQTSLSNGMRPDCIIYMPNNAPSLIIDAKFPLEAWNIMRHAENAQIRQNGQNQFRKDMDVHIRSIAQKYLIAGETQNTAFLFVPSESIFATIHEEFEPLIQSANRHRVIIVSPSLLVLSIQIVQTILRDARLKEQAHLIQSEVLKLGEDVARLDERVRKLQNHLQLTDKDIQSILTSTEKLTHRSAKINALELDTIIENETPKQKLH